MGLTDDPRMRPGHGPHCPCHDCHRARKHPQLYSGFVLNATGSGEGDALPFDGRGLYEIAAPVAPKHRHELTLSIGSNSLPDLIAALHTIADELRESGNRCISGSPSWAGQWHHAVEVDQTREKYNLQLQQYIEAIHG